MDTTNYCPLCEHYARAAEKLNDENRTLRQRVEELEGQQQGLILERDQLLDIQKESEARLARVVEILLPADTKWMDEPKLVTTIRKALAAVKGE